jgi:hypothetical protein
LAYDQVNIIVNPTIKKFKQGWEFFILNAKTDDAGFSGDKMDLLADKNFYYAKDKV